MADGNPIWPKRETSESLRERLPTSVAFLRETATAMLGFCELSRERFTEAADEIERLQHYPRVIAELKEGNYMARRVGQDIESLVREAAQAEGGE